MKFFAQYFRGFNYLEIESNGITFLVGDNSSGKSSALHLVDAISNNDLNSAPRLNSEYGVSEYDYFSPYFGYKNVTFGFAIPGKKGRWFYKAITVERRVKLPPRIVKCSYADSDLFVTLAKNESVSKYSILDGIKIRDSRDFLTKHLNQIAETDLEFPDRFGIADFGVLLRLATSTNRYGQLKTLFNNGLPSTTLVSPIRALPAKFYNYERKISPSGLHFASMYMDIPQSSGKLGISSINKFGKDSGLFDSFDVKEILPENPDSPLIVSIRKGRHSFLLNQVGVGISQVAPVLAETAFSLAGGANGRTVLIQQPELHLHPVAQAALGSYFFRCAKRGLNAILETHSSFLLDRFRAEIRDDKMHGQQSESLVEKSRVVFFQNTRRGNKATTFKIDSEGRFVGDTEEFHKFFIDELLRTMF